MRSRRFVHRREILHVSWLNAAHNRDRQSVLASIRYEGRDVKEPEMRIVAGCLLLVGAALASQQSSSEYHGIYGPSDVERFTVRPGITMTVEYGPDQVACQMIITRSRPLLATIHWPPTSTMLSENEMNQIIDELAPATVRGAKIQNLGGWQSGQAFASVEDYENAEVTHTGTDCKKSPAACMYMASIRFKRKECDSINKESSDLGMAGLFPAPKPSR